MIPGRTLSLDYLVGALLRRKWWIVVPTIALTVAAIVAALLMQNLYYSQTVILIVPQTVPATYVAPTITQPIESRLRTISEQIRSRSRLERVIQEFNLYPEMRQAQPIENVVVAMNANIALAIGRGDSFTLGFTYPEPETAAKVANKLATMFTEENLSDRSRQADGTTAFLERQLEEARQRLNEHDKKLEAYRQRYAGQLPTQLASNLQVISSTQEQVRAVTDATNRYRDQLLAVRNQIADAEASPPPVLALPVQPGGPQAPAGGTPAQQLELAQRELLAAEARLTPDHPDVVRLKRRIAELEPRARAEAAATGPSRVPQTAAEIAAQNRLRDLRAQVLTLERQIATNEVEETRLRARIGDYQSRVEALPARESELADLTRDYAGLQRTYQDLQAKKEASQLAASLERGRGGEQFKVLDEAQVPEEAASPNRPLIVGIGLILGLSVGFLLGAVMEVRDSSLRTQDDVLGALQLPVLALIPAMVTSFDTEQRHRSRLLIGAAAVVLMAGVGAGLWFLRRGGGVG
jgi:polysaccharide chain length determinant protein (PEP-CTERM system associated)